MPMKTARNLLRLELRSYYPAFGSLFVFSFFTTLLGLVPTVFMLQLSERVLASRNELTLLFLLVIATFLIAVGGLLDSLRQQSLTRVSLSLDERISGSVFDAMNRRASTLSVKVRSLVLNDLNIVRDFLGGSLLLQMFDLLWTPLLLLALFILHPVLGLTMVALLALNVVLTTVNQLITRSVSRAAAEAYGESQQFAAAVNRTADAARAMGMLPDVGRRWARLHRTMLGWQSAAYRRAGVVAGILKFFRTGQQVIILTVGALLYLEQSISMGTMFAAMIVGMRALQPVDAVAAGWRSIWNFSASVDRLNQLLAGDQDESSRMQLPRPSGALSVDRVVLTPPGQETILLNDVSFDLMAGRVLGVVGPSGAGKSCLARLLVGVWLPRRGSVALDGHDLPHWNSDQLGRFIGYVPQEVELLPGTVAENIARFRSDADHESVIRAAELAGIEDLIQGLPQGYNTRLGPDGHVLSGGQKQRVALARAVYGDPRLLVLDEPNSNLDAIGEQRLAAALSAMRDQGASVVIITHRLNMLIYCDDVLVMNAGTVHAFGPRDRIMNRLAPNRLTPQPILEAEFNRKAS
jgi:PrtD family type I secretion system ABC transporter